MIDSYRLALGDFEVTSTFEDHEQLTILFWLVFFFGTVTSLLIILNMVIAVMSSTFARVESENEAHIYREKLLAMLENMHRISSSITSQYSEHKYLLLLDIDPETDPIEVET